MMRVSYITVQLVLLDEYDAPKEAKPITFLGDSEGSAAEKLQLWLADLPGKLATAEPAPIIRRV